MLAPTAAAATAPATAAPVNGAPARRRRRSARALLLVASLLFALLAAEFAARWHVEGGFLPAVDSVLGLRTAEEPGGEAGVVFDEVLGYRLGPAVPGVNSRGVRHAELPVVAPPGQFRVLLLGDSIGFPLDGFFAATGRALATRSRAALELVNACVHGYTTYQERLFLERDLLPLRPDLVVLQYCINDNHRFLHRLTSSGRRLLTNEARAYLFPDGDGAWPWLTRTSYLVYALRKARLGQATARTKEWEGIGRAAWDDATWPDQEEHVRAIAVRLRAHGGELVVLAVPHEDQLDAASLAADREFVCRPQRRLGAICERLGVPFLDVHGAMVAAAAAPGAAALFTDRLHLSAPGHALVGAALAAFLLERGLVPLQ